METRRLLLRGYQRHDLKGFCQLVQDPEVVRFQPYDVLEDREAKKELRGRMRSPSYVAVILKEENRLIGSLYLQENTYRVLELGFLFCREDWGKGYAAEACQAVIDDAFSQGVHRVWARCDPDNLRSRRLLERLGFTLEGTLRSDHWFRMDEAGKPIWRDTCIYGKTP